MFGEPAHFYFGAAGLPSTNTKWPCLYRFNLLAWEAGNVFDKWYHELVNLLPWNSPQPRPERIALVEEFFRIGEEERRLENDLLTVGESSPEAREISNRLADIHERQNILRPIVEQTVEREVSSVLVEEGFSSRIGAILPPVDTVFGHSPALLVTSPRDRIFRQENTLLRHGIRPDERELLEHQTWKNGTDGNCREDRCVDVPQRRVIIEQMHHAANTFAPEWLHNWFFSPLDSFRIVRT